MQFGSSSGFRSCNKFVNQFVVALRLALRFRVIEDSTVGFQQAKLHALRWLREIKALQLGDKKGGDVLPRQSQRRNQQTHYRKAGKIAVQRVWRSRVEPMYVTSGMAMDKTTLDRRSQCIRWRIILANCCKPSRKLVTMPLCSRQAVWILSKDD